MSNTNKKMWSFSHKNGWYQIDDFLSEYSELHRTEDCTQDLIGCGYDEFSGFYYLPEPTGSNIIHVYHLLKQDDNKPQYIVEVCFVIGTVDYIAAKELPDVIELLSKLAPIAHASIKAEEIINK